MPTWSQKLIDYLIQAPEYADNLVYVKNTDCFLLYDEIKKYYKIIKNEDMIKLVYLFFKNKADKNITKQIIKDMVWHISVCCYRRIEDLPKDYIAFEDKLLNLSNLNFEDFDRNKYAYHRLPYYSTDIVMQTPVFDKFMNDVCVDENLEPDQEMKDILQEMFGYYVFEGQKQDSVFFLLGSGANGKSQFVNLLLEIIGYEFSSAISIQSLTTNRFAAASLIGKKVNICSEEESKYMKADKFKAMVTGDMIECDRKYGDMLFFRPNTKFLFATNNMPGFDHIGEAIRRRVKIIKFYKKIPKELQDKDLFNKMKSEIPGIIGWLKIGGERLKNNNYCFSDSKNLRQTMEEFEEVISSAVMFYRETYEEAEDKFIATDDIYLAYKEWCENNGRKVMSKYNMSKDIGEVYKLKTIVKWSAEHGRNMRGRQLKYKSYENEQPTIFGVGGGDEIGQDNVADLVV